MCSAQKSSVYIFNKISLLCDNHTKPYSDIYCSTALLRKQRANLQQALQLVKLAVKIFKVVSVKLSETIVEHDFHQHTERLLLRHLKRNSDRYSWFLDEQATMNTTNPSGAWAYHLLLRQEIDCLMYLLFISMCEKLK